MKCENKFFH